ncbi:MAG TPA: nicotinate-nucleotide adenylyltransferase [Blastocatellia bacterium]|nr:nicotinate-nucleotide adenylyltransferase [Blastocatellia bacterium]
MQVGLFGGTFDPVHRGHLEIARVAAELYHLDRIYFIPSGRPPHRRPAPGASAWHRYAMLVLATRETDNFFVSTIELETGEVAYTVDTVTALRRLFPSEAEFYFVLGADSFEEITQWKDYERLLTLTHLIVMARPGHALTADHLPERWRTGVVDGSPLRVEEPSARRIFFCRAVFSDVSATAIRQACRRGESIDHFVVPEVARYIAKYRLYANSTG